jgi:hypothetical protein
MGKIVLVGGKLGARPAIFALEHLNTQYSYTCLEDISTVSGLVN